MTSKTFIRITNKDIYNKLESLDTHIGKLNGKVLWHTWAIGVLLVLILSLFKLVFS